MRITSAISKIAVVALLACLLARNAWAANPPAPSDLVKAELVAEASAIAAGETLWLDLHLQIRPGWHIYWRNPGDSGLPTEIDWHLPAGFSAGSISWPVPEHFVQNGIGNYGYAGETDLLVPIALPKDLAAGQTVDLDAEASWLACADICIPGGAKLRLSLPSAAQSPRPDPAVASLFAAARQKLPIPAPFETRFTTGAHDFRVLVPATAVNGLSNPAAMFFPFRETLVDAAARPRVEHHSDTLEFVLPKSSADAAVPATLDGVLVLRDKDGQERAFEVSANPSPAMPPESSIAWWQALLLAFLGGIVLNAMPCVFPILSLKLLSLARHAHGHRAARLLQGFAYTAGVLASFAALGGALIALRAGGAAVGWGFQLQSPIFVAVLAYLLFAMGLSLSGVLAFGAGLAGVGDRFAGNSGLGGTFFTGVLATVVATPCTAPFMGTALGFAVIAPSTVAISIFLALGLGLAAPYLLATLGTGWQRILPKPGAWMDFVKQILAFPLYFTVAWLIWVLIEQVGPSGAFGALLGLVLIGFAAWIYAQTRPSPRIGRSLGTGLAIVGSAAAVMLVVSFSGSTNNAGLSTNAPTREGLHYEPFTIQRLTALEAEGKPVFVNMTASWCVTCIINERLALDSGAVRDAFAERGVVPLKGDWTNQNPEITKFLQQFGRSGVPLYLLYSGRGEPVVLPQILTATSVLDALRKS